MLAYVSALPPLAGRVFAMTNDGPEPGVLAVIQDYLPVQTRPYKYTKNYFGVVNPNPPFPISVYWACPEHIQWHVEVPVMTIRSIRVAAFFAAVIRCQLSVYPSTISQSVMP